MLGRTFALRFFLPRYARRSRRLGAPRPLTHSRSACDSPDVESSVPVIARVRLGARQLGASVGGGAILGLSAAALEWCANDLAGGLLPWPELLDLGVLYVSLGAFLGLGAGVASRVPPLAGRCGGSRVAVAVTILAFNALWILSSGSPRRGLLFLVGAPIYFWAVCRLGTLLADGGKPLIALQRSILALVSMVFGTLAAELLVDEPLLRAILVLAVMSLLPLLAVVLHEACMRRLFVPSTMNRLGPSAAVVLFLSTLIASPALVFSERERFAPLRTAGISASSSPGFDSRGPAQREVAKSPLPVPDERTGSPNILVISLDTTRADHLSIYGYGRDTTPRLAELAGDSLVFTNCVSTSTWTLPSHASLFTGLHPRTHGATLAGSRILDVDLTSAPLVEPDKVGLARPLAAEHETLAEILTARGYATAAIVANHSYLYRYFGLAQGFQYYDDSPGMLLRRQPNAARLGRTLSREFLRRKYRSAEDITSEAIDWLDSIGSQPFFLFLNFMEPHSPHVIPRDFRLYSGLRRRETWMPWLLEDVEYTRRPGTWSPHEADVYSGMYDDAIRSMDAEIGRLIVNLEQRGLYDGLMIVVFGDHGELLGEHGLVGHIGRTPYEGLVRVPLLVKYPGGMHHGKWDGRVQTLDLFPTILDAVQIEPGDAVQGEILPEVAHEIVLEQFVHAALAESDPGLFDRETRALYRGRYKLIATSRGELELYDLDADPREEADLSAELPEVLGELLAALAEWETGTPFYRRDVEERPSEHALQRLKSLGYVE